MSLTTNQEARLRTLEQRGTLTPDAVVADAEKTTSPLHGLFEWDDAVAAREHRLDQARQIIREVLVTVRTTVTTVHVQRYVPDPDRRREQGYVTLDPPPDEAVQRRIVIAECNRALGVMRRAVAIAEVLGMARDANATVDAWVAWRDVIDALPPAMAAD